MNNFEFDETRKSIVQGDMYLVPIKAVPDDAKPEPARKGNFIITHSETGHHHVIKERPDVKQYETEDQLRGYLEMSDESLLEHLRANDTHAPQVVAPGAWLIQRQGAYTPQGWERARD